jgi:hypothetical protein
MRAKLLFFTGALLAIAGLMSAGSLELQPKEASPPNIAQSEPWQFTIAAPGWWAGLNGTIGVNGVNADINIGFDQILQHLDMIFAARAEAQKGPFGIYGEVIYIGLSDGAQISGMINNIHEQVDQTLVDTALSWRLINRPRWSVDFAAGTHYTNVYERLTLNGDPVAVHQTSERFVDDVAADLSQRLDGDISKSEFLAALQESIRSVIVGRIGDRLADHEGHPSIPIGPLGGRIRKEVAQIVENYMELKLGALQKRLDALHLEGEARRAAAKRIVNATKVQIANDLAFTLQGKLDRSISRDDYWFDPYVGLRTRYDFNKTFYTAVRGEIGGFGVGADLMWEAEGVLGINLTRSIFTEVGYRALGADYENDGLLFDVVMHGPQITTGITF